MSKVCEDNPHGVERHPLRETGDVILSRIALLPSHFGVMLSIILVVVGFGVMTPPQIKFLQIPVANGITIAFIYYIAVTLAKIMVGNARIEANIGTVSPGMLAHGIAVSKIPLSEEEMMRFAIHEAGHILSLKLFPEQPRTVTAFVREYVCNPNGNVYYVFDATLDREYSWAHMLNTLAGQIAESVINGDYKIGSESDNQNWERQAKRHMNSGFSSDSWFSTPDNEAEAKLNSATLVKLRGLQTAKLREFMENNRQLLESTAYRLIEVDKIETEEAITIINAASPAT